MAEVLQLVKSRPEIGCNPVLAESGKPLFVVVLFLCCALLSKKFLVSSSNLAICDDFDFR